MSWCGVVPRVVLIVLTVKGALWDGGFAEHFIAIARIRIVEVTEPYVSMPGETATTPSRGVVLVKVT